MTAEKRPNPDDNGPIRFDFNEREAWTKTIVTTLKQIEPDPDRRCENCPSIAEYEMGLDFINRGEEDGWFELCPACVAEYTQSFDENNIFRR